MNMNIYTQIAMADLMNQFMDNLMPKLDKEFPGIRISKVHDSIIFEEIKKDQVDQVFKVIEEERKKYFES